MTKEERMMAQLGMVLTRLDTFPFSNHEAKMLGDCVRTVVLTMAGQEVDIGIAPGGGEMLQNGQQVAVHQQEFQRRGGVQISENCVQYPPAEPRINQAGGGIETPQGQRGALIDVQAGVVALTGKGVGGAPPRPDLVPQPVAGSLMAAALGGQSVGAPVPDVSEEEAMREMDAMLADAPADAPAPSETVMTPGK